MDADEQTEKNKDLGLVVSDKKIVLCFPYY